MMYVCDYISSKSKYDITTQKKVTQHSEALLASMIVNEGIVWFLNEKQLAQYYNTVVTREKLDVPQLTDDDIAILHKVV
jgi:hypothetical protein